MKSLNSPVAVTGDVQRQRHLQTLQQREPRRQCRCTIARRLPGTCPFLTRQEAYYLIDCQFGCTLTARDFKQIIEMKVCQARVELVQDPKMGSWFSIHPLHAHIHGSLMFNVPSLIRHVLWRSHIKNEDIGASISHRASVIFERPSRRAFDSIIDKTRTLGSTPKT